MSYLIISKTGNGVGDQGMVDQCTSAIFNYQVIGAGGVVAFSGSNHPTPDIDNEEHWIPIVTVTVGTLDDEPFRQHTWDKIRWKVTAGSDLQIYVASGVSG